MSGNIYIGGGGDEKNSKLLDESFVSSLGNGPLLYIPNALENEKYSNAFEWIQDVINAIDPKRKMELLTFLNKRFDISAVAGVYMGGGNTAKLSNEIYKCGFDKKIFSLLNIGKSVYGGSAGGILMGKDIRSAPEVRNAKDHKAVSFLGLNLLSGYSVYCHYNEKSLQDVERVSNLIKSPLILIPENSGIMVRENIFTVIGFSAVIVLDNKGRQIIKPGERYCLASKNIV